jgi:hypothetical protein
VYFPPFNYFKLLAMFIKQFTGWWLQGPNVDVPPSIAVTSTLLRVAGYSMKIICPSAHREQNGARRTNSHQPQSTQCFKSRARHTKLATACGVCNKWLTHTACLTVQNKPIATLEAIKIMGRRRIPDADKDPPGLVTAAEEVITAEGRPAVVRSELTLLWLRDDTAALAKAALGMLMTTCTLIATPPARRVLLTVRVTRQLSALVRPAATAIASLKVCWTEALKSARLMGRVSESWTCRRTHQLKSQDNSINKCTWIRVQLLDSTLNMTST